MHMLLDAVWLRGEPPVTDDPPANWRLQCPSKMTAKDNPEAYLHLFEVDWFGEGPVATHKMKQAAKNGGGHWGQSESQRVPWQNQRS